MTDRPPQPPEGKLIADALKRLKVSQREAAKRAGMSEGRLRQIISGFTTVSGSHVPVRGPAETVARISYAANVTPEQLEEAGRADAAEELRGIAPPPGPTTTISLAALAAIVEQSVDPNDTSLQRLLELWPRLAEWQRRSLAGIAQEMLSESTGTARQPDERDKRRTG